MSGITNPAEEYFKDGTWAWDPAASVWLKLIIDPLTNRLVIDHPGDIEVVQPVAGDLEVAGHGWDGAAWRKLPLIFGYSEPLMVNMTHTMDGGGNYVKETGTVPAGEIWVLQAATFYNNTGTRGRVQMWLRGGSNYLTLAHHTGPDQYVPVLWFGQLVMVQGDSVKFSQLTCLDNDVLLAEVRGYRMKIAE